jgi:hypothetical protein
MKKIIFLIAVLFSITAVGQVKPSQMSNATKAAFKTALDITNVDNTSDANKPISTLTQDSLRVRYTKLQTDTLLAKKPDLVNMLDGETIFVSKVDSSATAGKKYATGKMLKDGLDLKADTAGQAYTGTQNFTGSTITVPTPAVGDNDYDAANTAFVNQNTPIIQFQDNALKTVTGTTTETLVGTYTVKANSLGANGSLEIVWYAHIATAANGSTFRVYANGSLIGTAALSTNNYAPLNLWLINNNSTSAQTSGKNDTVAGMGWSANTSGLSTYTFDTTSNLTITFTIQPANSSYTGYIHRIRGVTYFSN